MTTTTTTTATSGAKIVGGAVDVRQWRESFGMSRATLAALARCSVTHLANIEAGVVPSQGTVMPRILQALNELEPPRNGGSSRKGVGDDPPADPGPS